MEFLGVWMATEAKVASRSKLLVFDDRGALTAEGEHLGFRGQKCTISLRVLDRPTLVSQTWNSIACLWVAIATVAVLALFYMAFGGPSSPWLVVVLFVVFAGFGIVIGRSTKWVQVKGIDDGGASVTYCFADGRAMGWSGIFGGTRALQVSLDSCLTGKSN